MLHIYYGSMILYNDILSTATGVTVKKAIFSREKHDYTPSEGKKLMIFCHSSAAAAVTYPRSMNTELEQK